MTESELVQWLRLQLEIAEKDMDMTTEEDWYDYHQGQVEAYGDTLNHLGIGLDK